MRANGLTTKHMERALTHMPMVPITTEIGSMTSSMAGEWNHGLMAQNTKANIKMARKMAEASSLSLTVPFMTENLKKTRSVAAGSITGPTASTLRVNGRGTRCTARAS